jgi:primosomal protein N' (replication factor Y)
MAQLIVQVAGRAGRGEKPGEVYIQTHHPEHPLLHTLLHQGYEGFARAALEERKQAPFPPFAHLALIRAEASRRELVHGFLQQAAQLISDLQLTDVEHFGPLPAPMEKRAGRYRAQLLLQAGERRSLHRLLKHCMAAIGQLTSAKKVRWSLDVDPQDMY